MELKVVQIVESTRFLDCEGRYKETVVRMSKQVSSPKEFLKIEIDISEPFSFYADFSYSFIVIDWCNEGQIQITIPTFDEHPRIWTIRNLYHKCTINEIIEKLSYQTRTRGLMFLFQQMDKGFEE